MVALASTLWLVYRKNGILVVHNDGMVPRFCVDMPSDTTNCRRGVKGKKKAKKVLTKGDESVIISERLRDRPPADEKQKEFEKNLKKVLDKRKTL